MYRSAFLLAVSTLTVLAQTPTTVRVSSETVPPGGMAQVKVLLTSPQPITGGGVTFDGALSLADGISLFSPTGDVFGVATQNGGQVSIRFTSPLATFGTNTDYPLATFTFGVGANAAPGAVTPVALDVASLLQTPTGASAVLELKPGTVTIGGSVSITDVIPGGGFLPAGATFSIMGVGFTPKTSVAIRGIKTSSVAYISANEIRATVKTAGMLDGTLIQVKNTDGSSDTYYSYMRGVSAGVSQHPLISRAVPIFSTNTSASATLPPMFLPQFNSPYAVGIALQNPGVGPATITLQMKSATGDKLAESVLTLAPRNKIVREVSEWFPGVLLPSGASVEVRSTAAVQALGLLANMTDGSIQPIGLAN